jgi:hypothetical protein
MQFQSAGYRRNEATAQAKAKDGVERVDIFHWAQRRKKAWKND